MTTTETFTIQHSMISLLQSRSKKTTHAICVRRDLLIRGPGSECLSPLHAWQRIQLRVIEKEMAMPAYREQDTWRLMLVIGIRRTGYIDHTQQLRIE